MQLIEVSCSKLLDLWNLKIKYLAHTHQQCKNQQTVNKNKAMRRKKKEKLSTKMWWQFAYAAATQIIGSLSSIERHSHMLEILHWRNQLSDFKILKSQWKVEYLDSFSIYVFLHIRNNQLKLYWSFLSLQVKCITSNMFGLSKQHYLNNLIKYVK